MSLLAYWRFSEIVGGVVVDESGNGRDLSVSGSGVTIDDDGGPGGQGCLVFDGTSYTVESADPDLLTTPDATIIGFVKYTNPAHNFPSGQMLFRRGVVSGDPVEGVLQHVGSDRLRLYDIGGFDPDTWVMFTHTRSGTGSIFTAEDDEPLGEGLGDYGPGDPGEVLRFGKNGSGFQTFVGAIAEVAIFDHFYTEEERDAALAQILLGESLVEVPMSALSNLSLLQYGKHTSNTQLEVDTSVSYVFAEYEGDLRPRFRPRKVERNLRRGDNEKYSRVLGGQEPPSLAFNLLLRGLNNNDGGAVTTAKQTELAPLFDVIFGANGGGGTGTTVSASGHTSTVLRVASAAGLGAGDGVLFNDGTELIAREIVSISSNDLTLDRAYSGTPTNGSTVFASCQWFPDNDAPNHVHLAVDCEHEAQRAKLFGGMGSFTVDFPANGGLALCSFSFDFTKHSVESQADPTFSAPTVGNAIPCIDGTFWLGANELLLRDAKLTVDVQKSPKQHYAGANGFAGYVVTGIDVVLEGKLLMGALTGEATASTQATLHGATAQDIAIQIGRAAGQTVYLRMPAADFDADLDSVDGQECLSFRAMATRSGNHSNVPGAARLHLF